MRILVNTDNGMNILGQGPKILLFTIPAVAGAVAAHILAPDWIRIPLPGSVLGPIGVALITAGAILWLTAVAQLVVGFPKGKLVRTGAYGVCRNPIYSSFGFFVLPGLSLLCGTWIYLAPAAVLCLGVVILIRREERDLLRVFGDKYRSYTARVHRIIPFGTP
jgi:protein-S-isoprenylcysteine O-methyltransferase Ste14